jgi:hypothetical protein
MHAYHIFLVAEQSAQAEFTLRVRRPRLPPGGERSYRTGGGRRIANRASADFSWQITQERPACAPNLQVMSTAVARSAGRREHAAGLLTGHLRIIHRL